MTAPPAEGRDPVDLIEETERLVRNIVWKSVDRDNMEFEARVSCYQRDAIIALFAAARQNKRMREDFLAVLNATLNMVEGNGAPPDWDWLRRHRAALALEEPGHG